MGYRHLLCYFLDFCSQSPTQLTNPYRIRVSGLTPVPVTFHGQTSNVQIEQSSHFSTIITFLTLLTVSSWLVIIATQGRRNRLFNCQLELFYCARFIGTCIYQCECFVWPLITLYSGIVFMTVCVHVCLLAGFHKYYCLDLPEKNQKMDLCPS